MIPTLSGRIQTRIFLLIVIGIPWTLILTPFLPTGGGRNAPTLGEMYATTFGVLGLVAVFGAVLWEPLYHLLQQLRWEKDWPVVFVLFSAIPEVILLALIVRNVPLSALLIHFLSTWILMWLVLIGPIRLLVRWRYRGGQIL